MPQLTYSIHESQEITLERLIVCIALFFPQMKNQHKNISSDTTIQSCQHTMFILWIKPSWCSCVRNEQGVTCKYIFPFKTGRPQTPWMKCRFHRKARWLPLTWCWVHVINVLGEGFNLLGFDLDPSVDHISERVWGCNSSKRVQPLDLHFLHVEVWHNGRYLEVHCTSMLFPVESLVVLEICSVQAEVKQRQLGPVREGGSDLGLTYLSLRGLPLMWEGKWREKWHRTRHLAQSMAADQPFPDMQQCMMGNILVVLQSKVNPQ